MYTRLENLDRLNYKTLGEISDNFKEIETALKAKGIDFTYYPIKSPKEIEPQEIIDNFNIIEENMDDLYLLLKYNPNYSEIEQFYNVRGIPMGVVFGRSGYFWENAYPEFLAKKVNRWINFQNYIWSKE